MTTIEQLSEQAYDAWMADSPDFPMFEDVKDAVIYVLKRGAAEGELTNGILQTTLRATLDKLDAN